MKKILLSALTLLAVAATAEAKNWKIGPSSVSGMDFASINAAMESSSVAKGDTLYLSQWYNENADQTVTKQVVIIGTGYDTSLTDEQVVATLTKNLNLKANGVVVKSVRLSRVNLYGTDCVLDRCYSSHIWTASTTAGLNKVYSCYINGPVHGYSADNYSQLDIQNCVIDNNQDMVYHLTNSIINNNMIRRSSGAGNGVISFVKNTKITNNIIINTDYISYDLSNNVYASGSENSIEHNILSRSEALSYYPTNKIKFGGASSWGNLFVQKGNYSDWYRLATETGDNPALAYATDGGEVGCHGGLFGCPAGGRPQYVPYFSKVTIGSRSESGKLPVSVTIKIQED